MRRLIVLLGVALMGQFGLAPVAFAAELDHKAPLQIPPSFDTPATTTLRAVPSGATGIHDVSIGGRIAPIRIRYASIDLIDARAAEALLGNEINHYGDRLRFDRPDTAERVEISLVTGQVFVDGSFAGTIDAECVAGKERLWMGTEALEWLAGRPVRISRRSSARAVGEPRQAISSPPPADAQSALLAPRVHPRSPTARLVLTSYRPTETKQPAQPSAAPLPALASFERVFGQPKNTTNGASQRSDWKAQTSWEIEPARSIDAPEPPARVHFASLETGPDEQTPANVTKRKQPHPGVVESRDQAARLVLASMPGRQSTLRAIANQSSSSARQSSTAGKKVQVRTDRTGELNLTDDVSVFARKPEPEGGSGTDRILGNGELNGAVVLDRNGDGLSGPADQRLEGERVQLIHVQTGQVIERRSASFGRFAFAGIPPGDYRLRVMSGWKEHISEITVQPGQPLVANAIISADVEPRAPPDRSTSSKDFQKENPADTRFAGLN